MTQVNAGSDVRVERMNGFFRGTFTAMASDCELLCEAATRARAREVTRMVAEEAWRIERKFSRYLSGNIVDRINTAAGKPVEVDAETARLIDFAVTLHDLSDGRFDVTSGPLRRIWTFDGSDRLPSPAAVQEVMRDVGWRGVSWSNRTLRMPVGMEIDLGGIGKEYAADRAAGLLRRYVDFSCLVNLGGDLVVTRAPALFECWRVGIEACHVASQLPESLLSLRIGGLATSGDARRYLEQDGRRYSQILDAQTGWPVAGAPRSVTVAADTCTQAGMLSTLAMLEGEGAETFLAAQGVRCWCAR